MGRLFALLSKELRHHFLLGLGLALFLPFAYLLVAAGVSASPDNITFLTAHVTFLWIFLPLSGLVIGNRLVVMEYQSRTQLFLEALPVRRIEMVTLKYLFGLTAMQLIAIISLCFTVLIAARSEPIDGGFFGIMALRTVAYVFFLWAVLFMMGFLGRFRIPLYIGVILLLVALDSLTAFELQRFGPFALVDHQLALDRESVPWSELALSIGLALACSIAAGMLALINEGSVAESLAKRMTLKEKSLAGGLVVVAVVTLTAMEGRREGAPFAFNEQEVLASKGLPLEIYYARDEARADAVALQRTVEGDLRALGEIMGPGSEELPPIRIALRESLDATTFEPVKLSKNDGVLLRTNFRQTDDWRERGETAFRAFVIREVLDEMTDGRADFEPKAWFRDGLSLWLSTRDDQCWGEPTGCPPLLRALWLTQGSRRLGTVQLKRWWRYRERHGEAMARGVALSGLLALEETHGEDAVRALARAFFGRPVPQDLREVLFERRHPMSRMFADALGDGQEWPGFVDRWNGALDGLRARPDVSQSLAGIPNATGALEIKRGAGAIRSVVARFDGLDRIDASTSGHLVALLHREVPPFQRPLDPNDIRREERVFSSATQPSSSVAAETGDELTLTGHYGPGTIVFFALELESELLQCPIRLHSERRVIE